MELIKFDALLKNITDKHFSGTVNHVVTDSRMATNGCIFVCIKGERTDGHLHGAAAVKNGAKLIIAQDEVPGVDPAIVVHVQSCFDALIAMGANYRNKYKPVVVGVTGSIGKTTTKDFLYCVLSEKGVALKTEGNQNNEIGMPNTLFRLDDTVEFAVVEMGMQGLGEIEKLSLAARPNAAIITGIGVSHIELLGSRENILKAKLEIVNGMSGGFVVLNADDDMLAAAQLPEGIAPVYCSIKNATSEIYAKDISRGEGALWQAFKIVDAAHGTFDARIPTLGAHNVLNALFAYAAGTRLGVEPQVAVKALEKFEPSGQRQKVVEFNGITVIEDCYNAGPESMRAAIEMMADIKKAGHKSFAVLGDMFELAGLSRSAHEAVAQQAVQSGVDLILTNGEQAKIICERANELREGAAEHFEDRRELVARLRQLADIGDTILFKASHGMRFEEIVFDFYE